MARAWPPKPIPVNGHRGLLEHAFPAPCEQCNVAGRKEYKGRRLCDVCLRIELKARR